MLALVRPILVICMTSVATNRSERSAIKSERGLNVGAMFK